MIGGQRGATSMSGSVTRYQGHGCPVSLVKMKRASAPKQARQSLMIGTTEASSPPLGTSKNSWGKSGAAACQSPRFGTLAASAAAAKDTPPEDGDNAAEG